MFSLFDEFLLHLNMSPTEIALYGKRLLPQLLDEYAQATPDRIYDTISIPRPELPPLLRDVKILEIAHCVNFYANLIQKKFGRSQSFETICYIGIPDLRYAICFLGAIKCGYKVRISNIRGSGLGEV